jgi:hypothetical protein
VNSAREGRAALARNLQRSGPCPKPAAPGSFGGPTTGCDGEALPQAGVTAAPLLMRTGPGGGWGDSRFEEAQATTQSLWYLCRYGCSPGWKHNKLKLFSLLGKAEWSGWRHDRAHQVVY